jgi:succinate-semialdehyde dehydrogenase/glutarate-semialdehyde dehydrogenase
VNTQTSERRLIDGVKKSLFIDGEWREAAGGDTMVVEDPSTGETLCEVADARPEDALAALGAASEAQAGWK